VLISGPIWAKPVWGIWWTWDARLTSAFLLWLIYMGYLVLRRLIESPEQRARLSAVFGVLGAVDAPIVYMSNRWWRTQHPAPVLTGDGELDPRMKVAFLWNLLAWTMWGITLIWARYALRRREQIIEEETALRALEG